MDWVNPLQYKTPVISVHRMLQEKRCYSVGLLNKFQFLKLRLFLWKKNFLWRKVTHNNILTTITIHFSYQKSRFQVFFPLWSFLFTLFKFPPPTILLPCRHLVPFRFYLSSHSWKCPFGTTISPFSGRAQSSILTPSLLFEVLVFTTPLIILLPWRWREQVTSNVSTYLPDYTPYHPRKP
jgi:hypothetical protein